MSTILDPFRYCALQEFAVRSKAVQTPRPARRASATLAVAQKLVSKRLRQRLGQMCNTWLAVLGMLWGGGLKSSPPAAGEAGARPNLRQVRAHADEST